MRSIDDTHDSIFTFIKMIKISFNFRCPKTNNIGKVFNFHLVKNIFDGFWTFYSLTNIGPCNAHMTHVVSDGMSHFVMTLSCSGEN